MLTFEGFSFYCMENLLSIYVKMRGRYTAANKNAYDGNNISDLSFVKFNELSSKIYNTKLVRKLQKDGYLLLKKNVLGSIYVRKNNNYRFAITNVNKLPLIIEYFNVYVLISKKQYAFDKWKVIYNCVLNKEHKTLKGMEYLK